MRVHGALIGWEAERLLREQIVAAVEAAPEIVLDLREMTDIDPGCLGALESGLIGGVYIEGGGPDVQALLANSVSGGAEIAARPPARR